MLRRCALRVVLSPLDLERRNILHTIRPDKNIHFYIICYERRHRTRRYSNPPNQVYIYSIINTAYNRVTQTEKRHLRSQHFTHTLFIGSGFTTSAESLKSKHSGKHKREGRREGSKGAIWISIRVDSAQEELYLHGYSIYGLSLLYRGGGCRVILVLCTPLLLGATTHPVTHRYRN